MNPRPAITVFGCMIDDVGFEEASEFILRRCEAGDPALVVTANVDHLVLLRRDSAFREAYEAADLCLADGMPLLWAARLRGTPLRAKVSGSDLFEVVCEQAAERGHRVALVGGLPGAAEATARKMTRRYPELDVCLTLCPPHGFERDATSDQRVVQAIRDASPHILFVALGAPKQELWLHRHRAALGVPVSIGVGATFDFHAGLKRRAPRWMQRTGLEWVHRLCSEPRRLARRYLVQDLPFVLDLGRLLACRLVGRRGAARPTPVVRAGCGDLCLDSARRVPGVSPSPD